MLASLEIKRIEFLSLLTQSPTTVVKKPVLGFRMPIESINRHVTDDKLGDHAPSNIVLTMYVLDFNTIKAIASQDGISIGRFFSLAYSAMHRTRQQWGEAHNQRYHWFASPILGGGVARVSVWLKVMDDMTLREWADLDGVTLQDAAYTAALLYMER